MKNTKDRKNAFKWVGAKGFSLDDKPTNSPEKEQEKFSDEAKSELMP